MEGRALYEKESTQFDPTHKFFVSTNIMFKCDAEDFALRERFEIYPVEGVFVDREPENERERRADLGLKDKLLAELPGILNWLIEGCLLWQAEGMEPVPEAIKAAGKEFHKDMDHVGAFLDEWTVRGPGVGKFGATKLFEAFLLWCKTVGLRKPFDQPGFGRSLRAHGLERIKNSNPVQYRDIRLTDEAQAKVDSSA